MPRESNQDWLPKSNEKISSNGGNSFIIGQRIGNGAYGVVYQCTHKGIQVALKTQQIKKSKLHMESNVLTSAKKANCVHICRIFDCGFKVGRFEWLAMTLLDKDLDYLRRNHNNQQFELETCIRLGVQTLEAVEELHGIGFVSRDIEPSNFAPGVRQNHQNGTIYLFDFGLARNYSNDRHDVPETQKDFAFRGTARYASFNAHQGVELYRRDDVESWFYGLVEMTSGPLPWSTQKNRILIGFEKKKTRTVKKDSFFHSLPKQYDKILTLIDECEPDATPDYGSIKQLLKDVRKERGLRKGDKWEWEIENTTSDNFSRN